MADGKQTEARKNLCSYQDSCVDGKSICHLAGDLSDNKQYFCGGTGTNMNNWIKCGTNVQQNSKAYGAKTYICNTKGMWEEEIASSPSSVVKVDLGKEANSNGWLHIGDEEESTFNDKEYTLPEKINLKFKLPYTIGDYAEIFFTVNGVTNSVDYNTEVELNGLNDWPIGDLSAAIGKPKGCGTTPPSCSVKDSNGKAVQLFKETDVFKGLAFTGMATVDIPFSFDLGKEGNNYDDIEIKNFYVRTGIISQGIDKFNDQNKEKTYSFPSTIATKKGDQVKLRIYTNGLYKPSTSDVKSGVYISKVYLNNVMYTLNAPPNMPKSYTEASVSPPSCVNFGTDTTGAVIEINVNGDDIKKTQGKQGFSNTLKITAGKKTTGGKIEYDDFLVGRIEVVVNENNDTSYKLSQASVPGTICAK